LSGAEGYKNNNATDATGKYHFRSLFPGEYFLRPLLKEYVFSPSSHSVAITEGSDTTVTFSAARTSYSLYGPVTSLNGIPEKGVHVDANSNDFFEETQTDGTGAFRLRGLVPNKQYKVRVRLGKSGSSVTRAQPSEIDVHIGAQDIEGVNFIAFRPAENKHEISGIVNVHVTNINPNEMLATLSVTLSEGGAGGAGATLDQFQLGPNNYFVFDGLDGDKEYTVKLKSSLSERRFSYSQSETKVGPLSKLEKGSIFLNLSFSAVPAGPEKHRESEPESFAALLVTILIGLGIYFYRHFWELVQRLVSKVQAPTDGDLKKNKKKL